MSGLQARCLCGAVGVQAGLPSLWVAHCHCTQCQRAHGAGVVTWVGLAAERSRILDREGLLRWFASSPGAERGFCGRCGSPLLFRSTRWPGELHVARASVTGPVDRAPQCHVFHDTAVDWLPLADDGLPRKDDPG